MPIKKVKICDTCGKQEDFYNMYGGQDWFIVNCLYVYCTEKCWRKKELDTLGMGEMR